MDFSTMTDAEVEDLGRLVVAELARRRIVADAPAEVERINRAVLAAEGRNPGGAWSQPTGAHDAYPPGWQVSRNGKTYESLVPGNVWTPGDPADPQSWRWWREVVPAGSDDWRPGVAYAAGAEVSHAGKRWRCAVAHTSQADWAPGAPGVYLWAVL